MVGHKEGQGLMAQHMSVSLERYRRIGTLGMDRTDRHYEMNRMQSSKGRRRTGKKRRRAVRLKLASQNFRSIVRFRKKGNKQSLLEALQKGSRTWRNQKTLFQPNMKASSFPLHKTNI